MGYMVIDGDCVACSTIDADCGSCHYDTFDSVAICHWCETGWWDEEKCCTWDADFCETCDSAERGNCATCHQGGHIVETSLNSGVFTCDWCDYSEYFDDGTE